MVGALITAVGFTACGDQSKVATATSASAKPSSVPSAPSAAPPKLTLVERAAKNEDEAVETLEKKKATERTAAEAVALAHARGMRQRKKIADIKRKIDLLPAFGKEKDTIKQILGFAKDREVADDLLLMLTTLKGDMGNDFLYKIWTGTRGKNKTTELAEELLYTKDVKPKSSKALAPVLLLRRVEKCEDAKKHLAAIKENGDRRAIPAMRRFYNKRGCGPKKTDDCWACLRKPDDVLKETLTSVRGKMPPL